MRIIISQSIISLKECEEIIFMDNSSIVVYDTHNLLKNCDIYKDIMRFNIVNGYVYLIN